MTQREKFVKIAQTFVGLNEADGSHRQIIDAYNRIRPLPRGYRLDYSDPWCAAFVSAVGEAADLQGVIMPECSCTAMISLYRKIGRWEERDSHRPSLGDLIIYDWDDTGKGDCTGDPDHVGIICEVNGNNMKVIEGNKSDRVDYRMMNVDGRYIRGYCLPAFSDEDNEDPWTEPQKTEEKAPTARCTVSLPVIRRGNVSKAVEALQILLELRGFDCGPCGADGEMGDDTAAALEAFQRSEQIEIDAVAGPVTWAALIGE